MPQVPHFLIINILIISKNEFYYNFLLTIFELVLQNSLYSHSQQNINPFIFLNERFNYLGWFPQNLHLIRLGSFSSDEDDEESYSKI